MNRRKLKKAINAVAENFADECLELQKRADLRDQVEVLLDEAVELLDDVMYDINHHSTLYGKEVKVHFLSIEREFDERFQSLEERLQTLKNSN